VNGLETAIYSKLHSSAEITSQLASDKAIYAYSTPENAPLPVVVFFQQTGTPIYTLVERAVDSWLYAIKAITQGDSMSPASALDDMIDELFTDQPLQVNGSNALSVRREAAIAPYTEFQFGVRYNHAGGSYRIWIGD
jgi:hypothetical protein